MRSALLCVIFTLLVRRGSRADDDFRPTPIPLNEWQPWHEDRRDPRAGTLHETLRTDPPAVAAVPAHYWEDALRHSVYLTLVRDKIDQLIAKGDVISPDTKPDQYASKDIDEHDLWEKIKTAPFDRIQEDEPASFGDVTIMAKGRLMEERGGFRFTEDERSKEKCNDDKCMDGVKAFWSVKRVRQREVETSPGKYHYELTFSVISQHPKKQRKPYENPVRTFTVKETSPEHVLDMPQEHRTYERAPIIPPNPTHRPGRAIWVHKNIVPTSFHQGRQYQHGLERIFSSLFSDDDDQYAPTRYRHNPHTLPQYPQYAKVGYVGSPSDQQKRLTPYPYKPQSYKYSRPIPPPPFTHMQHHYIPSDTIGHPYATPPDHRFGPPTKPMKTTRPAVLPTPLPPITPPKNWTEEVDATKQNTTQTIHTTEIPTRAPELITIHKTYNKPRPTPMKINYFPEHVRPPVYNAPPGVFVTMDKKPFKPLPPLKFISKPLKHNKPIDFRPSPQVLDMQQFSEPDPLHDTAFRPITWNYADTNTTEKVEVAESTTQVNHTRKTTHKGKKPPKKHENIKATRVTTATPEIITASSDSSEESDAMQWANVVGAFSKTTPMASQKEKSEVAETTTPASTTTSSTTPSTTTTTVRRRTTTTTEAIEETTSSTAKPKTKRTRPPPKFSKPDKLKKHKRITTTTTQAPVVKSTQDLTPQASSAAATKPSWTPVNKTQTTTTTTSTTTTTTPRPTTTTTKATTTTTAQASVTEAKSSASTTQPKIKNRFRQSTLLQKGTSVKHDKWSAQTVVDRSKPTAPGSSSKLPPRRKGSNFQGYVSSTTPRVIEDNDKYHEDHGPPKSLTVKPLTTTTPSYEETADQYESNSEPSDYSNNQEEDIDEDHTESDEQESRDHTEYIFQPSTTPSEITNEVDHELITTEEIVTSPVSTPKNKTKCKKKKPQTITEHVGESKTEQSSSTSTTTTEAATPSIFEELFGSFTVDDSETTQKGSQSTAKPDLEEQGSEKHGHFVKLDDDLQDFLDSLERGGKSADADEQYEDDDDDEEPAIDGEDSPYDTEEDNVSARDATESYDDYHDRDRPYSLLELMAME